MLIPILMLGGMQAVMLNTLRSEIRNTVTWYCSEPLQHSAALQVLTRPGFALHPDAPCRAGAIVLEIFRAIRGSLAYPAFQAAAGVELQMEAAFLFDDVADDEVDPSYGTSVAQEVSLAITLMCCGAAVASKAAHHSGRSESSLRSLVQLHQNQIDACAGQFLDAQLERRTIVSTDESLKMTSLKAGSLGRFAADFGASIATDDPDLIQLFGDFGFNLFTYLQLIDDLRDACPKTGLPKDLMHRKKTVPLVFFYQSLAGMLPDTSDGIMQPQAGDKINPVVRQIFKSSGAELFCAVVAEAFLNRARGNPASIGERLNTVERLEHFTSALAINPEEALEAS